MKKISILIVIFLWVFPYPVFAQEPLYNCGLFVDRSRITETSAEAFIQETGNATGYDTTEWLILESGEATPRLFQENKLLQFVYGSLKPKTTYTLTAFRKSSNGARPRAQCNNSAVITTNSGQGTTPPPGTGSGGVNPPPSGTASGGFTPQPGGATQSGGFQPSTQSAGNPFARPDEIGFRPSFSEIGKQLAVILLIFGAIYLIF